MSITIVNNRTFNNNNKMTYQDKNITIIHAAPTDNSFSLISGITNKTISDFSNNNFFTDFSTFYNNQSGILKIKINDHLSNSKLKVKEITSLDATTFMTYINDYINSIISEVTPLGNVNVDDLIYLTIKIKFNDVNTLTPVTVPDFSFTMAYKITITNP
jgi:hypothetical protein